MTTTSDGTVRSAFPELVVRSLDDVDLGELAEGRLTAIARSRNTAQPGSRRVAGV